MARSPKRFLRGARVMAFLAAGLAGVGGLGGCDEVRARRNVQEGNKRYHDSKYEEAIKLYDDALASQPQLAIGWFNLGVAHFAIYQPGSKEAANDAHAVAAINALNKYVQLVPDDGQARNLLLKVFKDSGHYEGAIAYYTERLEKDPSKLDLLSEMAQTYVDAGKFDDAIVWYRKLIDADPSVDGKADALYRIGVMQWRRLNKHLEVAGHERARIADEGLSALTEANELRKDHGGTLSYINLLYRERAWASEASYARAIDTASALSYEKQAKEAMKAAQAASNTPAGSPPPKPKDTPPPPKK
jgi:tetratricopeptide (TPR) repeat protein